MINIKKSERRSQEIELIKENILDSAVEIINTEGYEQLSIRKIASKIGYSSTLIYNYYKDKTAIIGCIIEKTYLKIIENITLEEEKFAHASFEVRFQVLVSTFVDSMLEEPQKIHAVLQSGMNIFADYGEMNDKTGVNKLYMFISEGTDEGIFRKISESTPPLIIVSILGFISFIVNNKIENKNEIEVLKSDFCKLLLNGILNKQEE